MRHTSARAAAVALCLIVAAGCGTGAPEPASVGGVKLLSRTQGRYFEVYGDGRWRRHIIKGVDIGATVPGKWFGEVPIDYDTAAGWFEDISAMNANTVLVYTLLKPGFYRALEDFNEGHPGGELMLIQQFWPNDEKDFNNNYRADYVAEYKREIELGIDALNGNADIPARKGKAWGEYDSNAMPYVLGFLVGREVIMEEARDTDRANPGKTGYDGRYVKTTKPASATECWYAEMADHAQAYSTRKYGWQAPVGYVSWPTLDPIDHPTERTPNLPRANEADDSQVLDPRHILPGPATKAGIFGSFHIYPYYPEFMYREPAYADYRDEYGVLRYGGYLKDFMSVLPAYPQIIGEFGLPTSLNMSHMQPEGFSQGEIDEQEQGRLLARLYRAILREGYAGGLIFEWADEWSKRNWVYRPYLIPFDRHALWHNVMDPEQCFGLMEFEPDRQPFGGNMKKVWSGTAASGRGGPGAVKSMYAYGNAEFLFMAVEFTGKAGNELKPGADSDFELDIGIDTLGYSRGTNRMPVSGVPTLPSGITFLLRLNSREGGSLLCRPDYNRANSLFTARPSTDDRFEHVEFVINRAQQSEADGTYFPVIMTDQSVLNYGDFNPAAKDYRSTGHWYIDRGGRRVMIRLPWQLIHSSDPSMGRMLSSTRTDLPPGPAGLLDVKRDELGFIRTPGFLFYTATTDSGRLLDYQPRDGKGFDGRVKRYRWPTWVFPKTHERLKKSYPEIQSLYRNAESLVPAPAK